MRRKEAGPGRGRGEKGARSEGTLTLTGLDQVRALADPLRVRMLGAFAAEERTTRQVAEILDEKPTRLYHHLKSLAAAGLIRKTRTRRNRGTLETYYRAVAGAFRADPALFAPPGASEASNSIATVVQSMLDQMASELRALMASEGGGREVQEEAHFGFLEVHAPERDMRKIRAQVDRLVSGLHRPKTGATTKRAAEPDRRYRLSIAFFPLDLPER
jgi:DNA-binding transcriptional ArsR family regulator